MDEMDMDDETSMKDLIEKLKKEEDSDKKENVMPGKKSKKNFYNKWTQSGTVFVPTGTTKTVNEVPCGLYGLDNSPTMGQHMKKQDYFNDEVLDLPFDHLEDILKDISTFWGKKDIFERYGYIYKRGILMYGRPGCGKSFAIQLIIKRLIEEEKGIVIKIENYSQLKIYNEFFNSKFRSVEPNRSVVVIIEDIDKLVSGSSSAETMLLSILDGINQAENVVYLATTNNAENLETRIVNRPSRFDRRYEFDYPDEKVRRSYFEQKLDEEGLNKHGGIDLWVEKSEDLTLSHLRELVIGTVIQENDFDIVVKRLHEMGEAIKPTERASKSVTGFGR